MQQATHGQKKSCKRKPSRTRAKTAVRISSYDEDIDHEEEECRDGRYGTQRSSGSSGGVAQHNSTESMRLGDPQLGRISGQGTRKRSCRIQILQRDAARILRRQVSQSHKTDSSEKLLGDQEGQSSSSFDSAEQAPVKIKEELRTNNLPSYGSLLRRLKLEISAMALQAFGRLCANLTPG